MKQRPRPTRLLRTGVAAGSIYARDRLRQVRAQIGPSTDRNSRLAAARLATAEDVRAQLGNLRGITMKLAQMAGYLDDRVPSELRTSLSSFQSNAPTMTWELAKDTMATSLGDALDLIAEIDPEPVAAASIGQVHWGRLVDGTEVAIKIQFPDARATIGADLANAALVASLLKFAFPMMNTKEMAAEVADRIAEELDYLHEAAVQEEFATYYKDHPYILIPAVHPEVSTDSILTTDFIHGARFDELITRQQDVRDSAGEIIFRFVFRSLYQLGLFNGDPHPGNYLFLDDGRVAFLDFGFAKSFNPSELAIFESMITAMVIDRDPIAFTHAIIDAGLLTDPAANPKAVASYFSAFYDLVDLSRPFTVTPAYATNLMRHTFSSSNPLAASLAVPRTFVVIQRINLGLYAILGALNATANWRAIAEEIWPFVDANPSTPIGEAESIWRQLHHPR
ncbi:MAG: ABC1 kinase family protein [Ferrimicrobium sp.]